MRGVAYDTPILGYRVRTCNTLRLWKAEAVESFDFEAFNHGDYYRAVEDKMASENITKVLYPNDEVAQGKILRLQQQYFFVSCSLQDMIRLHLLLGRPLERFPEKWAVQLNDTHPAIAVAELMRLLVDEHALDWDAAWDVTRKTLRLHQPHAAARGAGEVAGRAVRRAAAAPPRDHLRDQPPVPRRGPRAVPGRRGALARMSIIDEGGERCRAHGAPRDGRQPHGQRRRRAALRTAHRDGAARLLRAVAGEVRATSPTASRRAASWPSATRRSRSSSPSASATAGWRTSAGSGASSRWPTTRSSGGSGARSS